MKMQHVEQQSQQEAKQGVFRARGWQKGKSGNPSGRTRMRDRIDELVATFAAIHGRSPTDLEMISIRSAARLASAAASERTNAEQIVRVNNSLHRVLSRLGMAKPPPRPKSAAYPALIPMRDRIGNASP